VAVVELVADLAIALGGGLQVLPREHNHLGKADHATCCPRAARPLRGSVRSAPAEPRGRGGASSDASPGSGREYTRGGADVKAHTGGGEAQAAGRSWI
jgi:hypothetical protein